MDINIEELSLDSDPELIDSFYVINENDNEQYIECGNLHSNSNTGRNTNTTTVNSLPSSSSYSSASSSTSTSPSLSITRPKTIITKGYIY